MLSYVSDRPWQAPARGDRRGRVRRHVPTAPRKRDAEMKWDGLLLAVGIVGFSSAVAFQLGGIVLAFMDSFSNGLLACFIVFLLMVPIVWILFTIFRETGKM